MSVLDKLPPPSARSGPDYTKPPGAYWTDLPRSLADPPASGVLGSLRKPVDHLPVPHRVINSRMLP